MYKIEKNYLLLVSNEKKKQHYTALKRANEKRAVMAIFEQPLKIKI
jgi:hypothetical protein